MTAMEKYKAGMSLTVAEGRIVKRTLERNRKAKINIGRKHSRGPAGITFDESMLMTLKKRREKEKKKKRKGVRKKPDGKGGTTSPARRLGIKKRYYN